MFSLTRVLDKNRTTEALSLNEGLAMGTMKDHFPRLDLEWAEG